jgi:hypothetical protein
MIYSFLEDAAEDFSGVPTAFFKALSSLKRKAQGLMVSLPKKIQWSWIPGHTGLVPSLALQEKASSKGLGSCQV